MAEEQRDHELEDRANELYWTSDLGVNQIADELDLSKGALYEVIHPLRGAYGCPECGEGTVFANRTARDRSMLTCPECGWEGPIEEARPDASDDDGSEGSSADPAPRRYRPAWDARTAVGGALLGAAAGLAFVFWTRRR